MKKLILGVLAVLAIASLVACENKNEVPTVPNDTTIVNNESAENIVDNNVVETLSNEEMYQDLIDDYKSAINEYDLEDISIDERIQQKYDMLNLSLLAHIARYSSEGVELTYDFYDIDKNGVNELLVGASDSYGAIYSYDKNTKQPVKIYFQETLERGDLSVYDNGVIVSSGAGGAALHYYEYGRISEDGISYKLLEAIEEEYLEANENPVYRDANTQKTLDYKSLDEIVSKYIANSNTIK